MKTVLIALLVTLAATADARGVVSIGQTNDTTKPTVFLDMNDNMNRGPIIWLEDGVFPPPNVPPWEHVAPTALGCDGTYDESDFTDYNGSWNLRFPGTNFTDPAVQSDTYFFRNLMPHSYGTRYYYFTLRAQDPSGIKRMTVSLHERDVWAINRPRQTIVDWGPSHFGDLAPATAVTALVPVYQPGGNFDYWSRQLQYTIPQPHPFFAGREVALHFSLTDFGFDGELMVEVEDHAGNIDTGSVYLADDRLCVP